MNQLLKPCDWVALNKPELGEVQLLGVTRSD
jgi:hypothetical protein